MLSSVSNSSVVAMLALRATRGVQAVGKPAEISQSAVTASFRPSDRISLSGGPTALRDVGITAETLSRASSSLSVAAASLDRVAGLLDTVQAAVDASGTTFKARQSEIDSAIDELDHVTQTATFSGRPLLSGAYIVNIPGHSLTLPRVSSQTLGAKNPQSDATLSSLVTGRGNSLDHPSSSETASGMLRLASDQVGEIQTRIRTFREKRISSAALVLRTALEDAHASGDHLQSPQAARTGALLVRAHVLLQPTHSSSASGSPASDHVLVLVA